MIFYGISNLRRVTVKKQLSASLNKIIIIVCFLIVAAMGLLQKYHSAEIYFNLPFNYVIYANLFTICLAATLTGIVAGALIYFLLGKKIKLLSVILYAAAAALIVATFFINISNVSLGSDATGATRWLKIGDIAIDSAAFLPFVILFAVFIVTEIGKNKLFLYFLAAIVPAVLVIFSPNLTPAALVLFTLLVLLIKMNADKYLNIKYILIVIVSLIALGVLVLIILNSDYFMSHLALINGRKGTNILSRYTYPELTVKEYRPFGMCLFEVPGINAGDPTNELIWHRRLELVTLFYSNGYGHFIIYMTAMICMLVFMFILCGKTDKPFEKYSALGICIYFTVRFTYALLSQFVLTVALASPPFIGGETSIITDIILLAIMLALTGKKDNGKQTF